MRTIVRGVEGRGGLASAALACALALGTLATLGGRPGAAAPVPAPARGEGRPSEASWELVVEGLGDGAASPLLVVTLGPDGRFGIAYRHSVEKSPVVDWFQVSPEPEGDGLRIALKATEYRSFGAGLPTDAPPGARFRRLGDRFLIEGLDVPVPFLAVRPLQLSEHVLIVGEGRWALSGLAADGAPLRVYARVRPEGGGVP